MNGERRHIDRAELHTHEAVESWAKLWLRSKGWDCRHNSRNTSWSPKGQLHIFKKDTAGTTVAYFLPANIQLLSEQCTNMMHAFDRSEDN